VSLATTWERLANTAETSAITRTNIFMVRTYEKSEAEGPTLKFPYEIHVISYEARIPEGSTDGPAL
jgi:hypothetical protein